MNIGISDDTHNPVSIPAANVQTTEVSEPNANNLLNCKER